MGDMDQSGLIYQRNRYYNPAAGQFTQGDPIGIEGGLNPYGYANGDPMNYRDPFGLTACGPPDDPKCERGPFMKLGEFWKGKAVREAVNSGPLSKDIDVAANATGVDAALIKGIIYEEFTHEVPFERLAENLGLGNTVGLGQVTVGLHGVDVFTRGQLLDPSTNVRAIAIHLSDIQAAGLIDRAGRRRHWLRYITAGRAGRFRRMAFE